MRETQIVDEVLLYMGQKCNDKVSNLEFSAGAKSAELSLTSSATAGDIPEGEATVLVRMFTTEGGDPKASVLARAREVIKNRAESARCAVKAATQEGWPADALVVEDPKVAKPKDGEIGEGSCGPYGSDPSASSFWRVMGGYAYFFDLGQDLWEVDPGSFTVVPMANVEAARK